MTKPQPFAFAYINSLMPENLQFPTNEPITKKSLKQRLVKFAQQNPKQYTEIVPLIKQMGDEFATYEGISVGLDDIEPDYEKRDAIVNEADKKLKRTTDPKKRAEIFITAQQKVKDLATRHAGDLGMMARSGGRGNVTQLMKTVASPVVVGDFDGNPVDTLIKKSYAEGLSPMEYWVASNESRGLVIKGQLGTAEPGDVSKILSNVSNRQVVSEEDCGTKNGIRMSANDPQAMGRYLARDQAAGKRNDPVDTRIVQAAKGGFLFVRSPLTCEARNGICSYCQGIMNNGARMQIGENAGLRSAQALSEPLTQMALSSKHGVSLVEGATRMPRGLNGLRQFLEAPKNFAFKAEVAATDGKVEDIQAAPQGGTYVFVKNRRHYVPPGMTVAVKKGQQVYAGDVLSEGVPHPVDVVEHKGLGAGRKYLTEQLQRIYQDAGTDIDTRNIENIIVNSLNHVKIEDAPEDSGLLPGEIVNQNTIDRVLRPLGKKVPLHQAKGRVLAENYLHHVAGTPLKSSMMKEFEESGITQVNVLEPNQGYRITPFMTSVTRSPLLNPNWLNKLGHRYLKSTILQGAHFAEEADTRGYEPLAAYVRGTTFSTNPKDRGGRY